MPPHTYGTPRYWSAIATTCEAFDPSGGTLFKGDEVSFVVSEGPELIEIPSVWNEPTDEAIAELEDLGFVVRTERAQIYFNGSRAWSTDPQAGTLAEKGSEVTIYVV